MADRFVSFENVTEVLHEDKEITEVRLGADLVWRTGFVVVTFAEVFGSGTIKKTIVPDVTRVLYIGDPLVAGRGDIGIHRLGSSDPEVWSSTWNSPRDTVDPSKDHFIDFTMWGDRDATQQWNIRIQQTPGEGADTAKHSPVFLELTHSPPATIPPADVAAAIQSWYWYDGATYGSWGGPGDPPVPTLTLKRGQGFQWPAATGADYGQLKDVYAYVRAVGGSTNLGGYWLTRDAHTWTPPVGLPPGEYELQMSVYSQDGGGTHMRITILP